MCFRIACLKCVQTIQGPVILPNVCEEKRTYTPDNQGGGLFTTDNIQLDYGITTLVIYKHDIIENRAILHAAQRQQT